MPEIVSYRLDIVHDSEMMYVEFDDKTNLQIEPYDMFDFSRGISDIIFGKTGTSLANIVYENLRNPLNEICHVSGFYSEGFDTKQENLRECVDAVVALAGGINDRMQNDMQNFQYLYDMMHIALQCQTVADNMKKGKYQILSWPIARKMPSDYKKRCFYSHINNDTTIGADSDETGLKPDEIGVLVN